MLLNLLIALYNDKMQQISVHKKVIVAVHELNALLFVHDALFVPFIKIKAFFSRRRKLSPPQEAVETFTFMEDIVDKI